MVDTNENPYEHVTANDILLASIYFPILVEIATEKTCVSNSELISRARTLFPKKTAVQKAVPLSLARKLEVVRLFTSAQELPDLTCLVFDDDDDVSTESIANVELEEARAAVYAFDWSKVGRGFRSFIKQTQTLITPRKRIKKPQALEMMATYYSENRERLPASVRSKREQLIELLLEGFTAEEAFAQVTRKT